MLKKKLTQQLIEQLEIIEKAIEKIVFELTYEDECIVNHLNCDNYPFNMDLEEVGGGILDYILSLKEELEDM